MENLYDLIIIGSGPAGLSAAIYAQRAMLKTIVMEKDYVSGGQVINTFEVDNYPGLPGVSGYDLAVKMREHAQVQKAEVITACVNDILIEETKKKVITDQGDYYAKAVLIATGARHRLLGVPGEKAYSGMGVSYCATCDGAFFKDKEVLVIGGGDVAVEDAIFLSRTCKKVYLVHRRDELRAAKSLQEKLFHCENVTVIWDTAVKEIIGDNQVNAAKLEQVKTNEMKTMPIDGIFVAIGTLPNTQQFKNLVKMDAQGYICAGEDGITNISGIYAAGDVRTKELRQIITAASDGANAVYSVQKQLS